MKRAFVCLVVVLGVAGCSEDGPPPSAPVVVKPVKPTVAQVSGLAGRVTLTRDGQPAAAAPGPVFEGDVIDTGPDGHALLKAGGREVELLEDSSFRVGASLAELTLTSGELLFEELDGGAFNTSAGSARAEAGSRVRLQLRDGGTSFEVGSGSFELIDPVDGGVSAVKAGERYVLGSGVFSVDEPPPTPPAPVVPRPTLQLTPHGAVTLKPKSGPALKLAPEGLALDEAGTFTVDKAGGLRAEVPGAVLQFEGASKGTIEPQSGEPKLRALLAQGGLRIFLQAGQSVLLDGKNPVTLRAKTTLTALVTPTKTGPRVELLGGEGEAALPDGLPRNLAAGDVATPVGKGFQSARRPSPVLTLSAGRTTRVSWGRPAEVTLAFAPGDGELEVATEAAFQNVTVRAQGGDALVVPAPLKGPLFWRRKGDAEPSGGRFEKDETAGAVSAKSDTVAETGLKATVYFQGAVPTLTFTFPPKDTAAAWRFRVYAVSDLKTPLVERKVNENRTVVDSGALREGSYVWSAVAMDKAGVEAPGGRMNKMDIVFDNSVTRLVLAAPRDGERAVNATGVAPLGSRLSLNGKPVALDEAGRFSVPVGGAAVLVFKLVTRDGSESVWVRRPAK